MFYCTGKLNRLLDSERMANLFFTLFIEKNAGEAARNRL